MIEKKKILGTKLSAWKYWNKALRIRRGQEIIFFFIAFIYSYKGCGKTLLWDLGNVAFLFFGIILIDIEKKLQQRSKDIPCVTVVVLFFIAIYKQQEQVYLQYKSRTTVAATLRIYSKTTFGRKSSQQKPMKRRITIESCLYKQMG